MYPSFTSLSQRERKRNELLEKAKRRVAQANAKREMYSDAAWSSDVGKIIDVNRNSKVDAQTQAGEPDINKPSVLKDAAVGEEKVQDQQGIDATTEPLIEPTLDEPVVEPIVEEPSVVEAPVVELIVEEPSVVEAPVVEPIVEDDPRDSRDYVRELYRVNPSFADLGINPIKDNRALDNNRYIGLNGFLYSSKIVNKKSNSRIVDWNKTYERVKSFIDSRSWIVDLFRNNPNWSSLRIYPNLTFKIQEKTADKKIDRTIDRTFDKSRYFGAEGDLYDSATNKISSQSGVDWVRTTERIQQMFFASENKSMAERKMMKGEDRDARPYSNIKGIRPAEDQTKGNFDKVRAIDPYSEFNEVYTSTTKDNINDREKLLTMMEIYSNKLAGAKIIVRPVLLDETVSNDTRIIVDSNRSIQIRKNNSKRNLSSIFSKVSWTDTLERFLSQTRHLGLDDKLIKDREADPKRFKPSDKASPDLKVNTRDATTGLDKPNADITDNESRKFLEDFFNIYGMQKINSFKSSFHQYSISSIEALIRILLNGIMAMTVCAL
jgi:hypothetical protein